MVNNPVAGQKDSFRLRWRKGTEIQATAWGIVGTVAIAILALTLYLIIFVR